MSDMAIDLATLSEKLGVSKATVYRWREWGLMDLFDAEKGGFDVDEVRDWARLVKRERRRIMRPPLDLEEEDLAGDIPSDSTNVDYGQLYRRGKAALVHIQVQKLRNSLIDRSEVEDMLTTRVAEITAGLENLASSLAPILAPLTDPSEIQSKLRTAFHRLRDHYAREDHQ